MIEIKTEKVYTNRNRQERLVLSIKALEQDKLPRAYLDLEESVRLDNQDLRDIHGWKVLSVGELYEEEIFQGKPVEIHKDGDLLAKINQEIKAGKEAWNGDETFLI